MVNNRHVRRSFVRPRSRVAAIARTQSWSRSLVKLVALVALAIQMLVVQTHIHISQSASLSGTATAIVFTGGDQIASDKVKPSRDSYPINQDPANCPLCQELTHSGQFLHSVAVLIALPFSVTVNFIPLGEVIPSLFSVSHSWQGRAPPQA